METFTLTYTNLKGAKTNCSFSCANAALNLLVCFVQHAQTAEHLLKQGRHSRKGAEARHVRAETFKAALAAHLDGHGTLIDYQTGDYIRPATADERKASDAAGPEGVILVNGRSCYVEV